MDTLERYAAMRRNRGEAPHEISEDRFWYLLEVLPPADWTRGRSFECFRVIECETDDLYTWAARLDGRYWEMVAPQDSTPAELLAKIYTAAREAAHG